MYFLIDYENINYKGLEGTEVLEKGDTISFFYSKACEKIVAYRMEDIKNSGCKFEIYKLKNEGKNALDFCIASKVGEIFGKDEDAKIAIITSDKAFVSVKDYWISRISNEIQLVISDSIANAIKSIKGEKDRKSTVINRMLLLDLNTEYAKYEERERILSEIKNLFSGTDYEMLINQIYINVISYKKPKALYINLIKSFGMKTGTDVYRKLRNSA